MNRVDLVGRLTRDPQVREFNGKTRAKFTLACNDGEKADYPSCIAWGRTAEVIRDYLGKGNLIGVSGKIQTGSFTGDNGETVYTTEVLVRRMEFLEKKKVEADVPDFEALDVDVPF